jgi:hypothetical protein
MTCLYFFDIVEGFFLLGGLSCLCKRHVRMGTWSD